MIINHESTNAKYHSLSIIIATAITMDDGTETANEEAKSA